MTRKEAAEYVVTSKKSIDRHVTCHEGLRVMLGRSVRVPRWVMERVAREGWPAQWPERQSAA